MTTTFSEIRDFVIENGRVIGNGDGTFDTDSLTAEIEFECGERGMDDAETAEAIAWALTNTSNHPEA